MRVEAEVEEQMKRHYSRNQNTVVDGNEKVHRNFSIKI